LFIVILPFRSLGINFTTEEEKNQKDFD